MKYFIFWFPSIYFPPPPPINHPCGMPNDKGDSLQAKVARTGLQYEGDFVVTSNDDGGVVSVSERMSEDVSEDVSDPQPNK